ncbi:carboxypeptidase-like regulatory domain-containing protein [Psychroserpens sp. SPM9]|uniref:carboxypeptidase-like regulatory domain-containing protein n=1 Tax=Psychroserpens sp. SPM9 TaxID=2975598 RepID=UPI0021A9591F|nr:carboxypeptidase-like regulatory domain-containing protein [Psychroserpens sp. SPM9]MDG5492827.1 carboxypeptidase-like regulatory domain-containing protein [Psychroserpens sp. SPM9]
MIFSSEGFAQTQDIKGKIEAKGDLVGIHIINKSASKFTITNDDGEFVIPAKQYDTIMVSGIQYEPKEFVISDIIMQSKQVTVNLEDKINVLDQVIVGKILTGDLTSDIENSDAKRDINFYDVGIPGYTGRRMTLSERRVYEANSGGGLVPLNPLINWITGRTKRLKEQVKRDELNLATDEAMAKYSKYLFENDTLSIAKQQEFFYFMSYDEAFLPLSKSKNEYEMLEFLKAKLKAFKLQVEDN